jgi:DNA polymerase III alpha subunit (gram-positive type)
MPQTQNNTIFLPASIDVETTGLNPLYHEIIQVAVLLYDPSYRLVSHFVEFIRPDHPRRLLKKAMEVNKIDLKSIPPYSTQKSIKKSLLGWIRGQNPGKITKIAPLGHNYATFDMPFLKSWLKSNYDNYFDYHVTDTCQIAIILKDAGIIRVKSCTLTNLCEYFHIIPPEHDAKGDALCTLEVYKRLIGKLKELNNKHKEKK